MIIIKKLRYKNFLQFGNNFTEVNLNEHHMTLFVGKNGKGKSTMIDALCYVLYKKAFRNIGLPDLINSVNQKNMLVEIEFSIGKNEFLVKRGKAPEVFEIYHNGVLRSQDATTLDYQSKFEREVLKMNFTTFKQVVVLGSTSYTPFMKLTPEQRRNVNEDLLSLSFITKMRLLYKDQFDTLKKSLEACELEIRYAKDNLEHEQKKLVINQTNRNERITEKKVEIDQLGFKINEDANAGKIIQDNVATLHNEIKALQIAKSKQKECSKHIDKLQNNINTLEKDIQFFQKHKCPTCDQPIDESHRDERITNNVSNINNIKISIKKIEDIKIVWDEHVDRIEILTNELADLNIKSAVHTSAIGAAMARSRVLHKEVLELENQKDDIVESQEWEKLFIEESKKKEEILAELEIYKAVGFVLKDEGYKTQEVKKYLPKLNILINKYLALFEFPCKLTLDEMFKETFKSRHRESFRYESFSEGQKLRIDLAIMFAWRALAKGKNSAATNILIMDEIFDGPLDYDGLDEILKCLQKTLKENIMIISPKGDHLKDKFDCVYNVDMYKNFSRIRKEK